MEYIIEKSNILNVLVIKIPNLIKGHVKKLPLEFY